MTNWDAFLATLVATFFATLPAVFIGIWGERKWADRLVARAGQGIIREVNGSGSVVYNVRDWARAIQSQAAATSGLALSNSTGSSSALSALAQRPGVPDWLRIELVVLADHVSRLHLLSDGHLGTGSRPPAPLAQLIKTEATFVADVAQRLIENCRQQDP